MTAGEHEGHGFHQTHQKVVEGAIEQTAAPPDHASDAPLAGAEPASYSGPDLRLVGRHPSRSSCDRRAERVGLMRLAHARFETTVTIGELTVAGVLPGASWLLDPAQSPVGSIAIDGDVQDLSCDDALELVDALLLVVLRMDRVAEGRHGAEGWAR